MYIARTLVSCFLKGPINDLTYVLLSVPLDRPRWLSRGGASEQKRRVVGERLIKNTKEKGRGQQIKLENKSPVSEQPILLLF